MAKKRLRPQTRTLFEPNCLKDHPEFGQLPYCWAVRSLSNDSENQDFQELEPAIFSHVLEHEISLYEPRGWIIGPLKWKLGKQRATNLGKLTSPVRIPAFVEQDAVRFEQCTAQGILLVENERVFRHLAECGAWAELNVVLVTGSGIPRVAMRRLLHRFVEELKKPVYLLTDNDTWGYFIFSLLKRGMMGPHAFSECLGISDLRFVGLRADDAKSLSKPIAIRPWKPIWDERIKHMRSYSCFRNKRWQQEFDRFEKQGGGVDLYTVCDSLGYKQFVREYLSQKLRLKKWLR